MNRQVNPRSLRAVLSGEARLLLLRESDIFELGGIGGLRQSDIPGLSALGPKRAPVLFAPYRPESRKECPSILYVGGKISGRVGRFELGALSVRQAGFGGIDAKEPVRHAHEGRCPEGVESRRHRDAGQSPVRMSTTRWRGLTSFIATRACPAADRSKPTCGISKAIPKAWIPIRRLPVSVCACLRTRGSGAGSNTRRTRPISIRRSASSIAATFPMPRPISVICCALLQDTCNRC